LQGFNAMMVKIADLLAAGKATKNGLLNSCSIAGIMLTAPVSRPKTPLLCAACCLRVCM
jgi:hypothetical protein